MKALSQSEYGVIRSLYQDVYSSDVAESILDEFTDELNHLERKSQRLIRIWE